MPRPRNKEDLIIAATTNYEKLLILIESRAESIRGGGHAEIHGFPQNGYGGTEYIFQ